VVIEQEIGKKTGVIRKGGVIREASTRQENWAHKDHRHYAESSGGSRFSADGSVDLISIESSGSPES
jgi:hypothetical protein